jgi:hypothetical protein
MLHKVRVRKRDGTIEDQYVNYGAFVGNVYPDGSVVEEVLPDSRGEGGSYHRWGEIH